MVTLLIILSLFKLDRLLTIFSMLKFTVFKGSANGKVVEHHTERPVPTEAEVFVRITHCGICGTDQHYRHADMVLGHEGAGVVEAMGDRVTSLKV